MDNYDLNEKFRSRVRSSVRSSASDTPGSFDFDSLTIQRPDNLPAEVDTQLSRYNEAIKRFDIQQAEEAADEILHWLHCMGAAVPA